MGMSLQTIIARDNELTRFKHYVLDNPDFTFDQLVDGFGFQHVNPDKHRDNLVVIVRDTIRYPHRTPKL